MIGTWRFIIVYSLLAAVLIFIGVHRDTAVPILRPLEEVPDYHRKWRLTARNQFDSQILEILKPTDYLSRQYMDGLGNRVSLYVGYHDGGDNSGQIHSPRHCLPGSGWCWVSTDTMNVPLAGDNVAVVKSLYEKGDQRELFLYWFQVRGKTLTSEYALKLSEIFGSLLHGRRDATFIRISVPVSVDEESALNAGRGFIEDFYPVLKAFLPS